MTDIPISGTDGELLPPWTRSRPAIEVKRQLSLAALDRARARIDHVPPFTDEEDAIRYLKSIPIVAACELRDLLGLGFHPYFRDRGELLALPFPEAMHLYVDDLEAAIATELLGWHVVAPDADDDDMFDEYENDERV